MPLREQPVTVPLSKLDTSFDPKTSLPGTLELVENAVAQQRTDGGIEFIKRPGLTYGGRTLQAGGSITAGRRIAALRDEIVMMDANVLYANDGLSGLWIPRGNISQVSAVFDRISDNDNDQGVVSVITDVAFSSSGYACFVYQRAGLGAANTRIDWYVKVPELNGTPASIVGSGTIAATAQNPRVVAVGSAFFIFYDDGGANLLVRKIDSATPNTISGASTVASNKTTGGPYDVFVDITNTRMVVGYQNTTPNLTLKIWNTNMTGGTSVAYATRNPDACIGFVDHTFADGNGYVVIGVTADATRILTFGASSMTVTADVNIDSTVANYATGYKSSVLNVFYSTSSGNSARLRGYSNGTNFTVFRGMALGSKVFAMGGKRYILGNYAPASRDTALFLIELEQDANGTAGDRRIGGFLMKSVTQPVTKAPIGNVAVVDGTTVLAAYASFVFTDVASAFKAFTMQQITLDFSGDRLGAPVQFADVLHIPGAVGKIYDGHFVVENGFCLVPPAPTGSVTTGGTLEAGARRWCAIFERTDRSGRRHQSSASTIDTQTTDSTNKTIIFQVGTLRATDADPAKNLNSQVTPVKIVFYCTTINGSVFYRVKEVLNDPTVDLVSVNFTSTDAAIAGKEPLYTHKEAGNMQPPAPLVYEAHRDRLFAASSDVVYLSKDVGGIADPVAFCADTDGFFLDFDRSKGPLVGLASDGTTLFICRSSSIYPLQGDGPDLSGNNGYQFPLPLTARIGLRTPRGFVASPQGIILDTYDGKQLLAGGSLTPLPGVDAYDSLTVTGGVSIAGGTTGGAAEPGSSWAVLTTAEGRALVWDWQLQCWYTFTNCAAVACCLWAGVLLMLQSDGTSKWLNPAAHADNSSDAIPVKLRTSWLHLAQLLGLTRVWKIQVLGEWLATFTFSAKVAINFDATIVQTLTKAVTAGQPAPLEMPLKYQEFNALQLTFEETSTTLGFKLSALVLEAGFEPRGLRPLPASQAMG